MTLNDLEPTYSGLQQKCGPSNLDSGDTRFINLFARDHPWHRWWNSL